MAKTKLVVLIGAIILVAFVITFGGCGGGGGSKPYGKYVNSQDSNQYLELRPDGNFFLKEKENFMGTYFNASGIYEIKGNIVTLKAPLGATNLTLNGNTLVDMDGQSWIKR